jgi:cyclic beta-1,2-glucan synthetase
MADPGYHLIAEGRPALERSIGSSRRCAWRIRAGIRLGIAGYVGAILLARRCCCSRPRCAGSPASPSHGGALLALAAFIPATEVRPRSSTG